jgi:hypothetical protein
MRKQSWSGGPLIDEDALRAAVEAHKADARAKGEKHFSRRRVILIADLFGMKPMQMVWQIEKRGLLKRGAYAWFKANGGITNDHIIEVRVDREAALTKCDGS